MEISSEDRVRAPDGVLVRELDGEAVILNLGTETYHGLDPVGTRMWTILTTAATIEAAIQQLVQEFDVEEAVLRRDVLELIETLVDERLLEIERSNSGAE